MKESRVGGRVAVYVPDHPRANGSGYVLKHRHLMEQKIGRILRSDEEVHHIDHNKENNDISNLQILSSSDHAKLHFNLASGLPVAGSIKARKIKSDHGLDYVKIQELMESGLGYRKIAPIIGEPLYSVRDACRKIKKMR